MAVTTPAPVSSTPSTAMPAANDGLSSAAGDAIAQSLRAGTGVLRSLADVANSAAGPALLLFVGGALVAVELAGRRRR